MAKALTKALEAERVSSAGPTQAKATETSGASKPETQPTAGPAVLAISAIVPPDDYDRSGARASVDLFPPATSAFSESYYAAGPHFPLADKFAEIFKSLGIGKQSAYHEAIRDACAEFGIVTAHQCAAFLAQVGHESGGLQWLEELGGKTYWVRYEGRKDLGNYVQGDGIKYHGRGLIQLTGKANYAECGRDLGLDLVGDPEQAAKMPAAARIAAWFWCKRALNRFCDGSDWGFRQLSLKINGGATGLQDRFDRWRAIRKIMGIDPRGA